MHESTRRATSKEVSKQAARKSAHRRSETVLKAHVGLRRQADTSLEDVLDGGALSSQSIDHWRAARHQRRFGHVGEQREHRVEAPEFVIPLLLEADALAELAKKHKVQDQ